MREKTKINISSVISVHKGKNRGWGQSKRFSLILGMKRNDSSKMNLFFQFILGIIYKKMQKFPRKVRTSKPMKEQRTIDVSVGNEES